MLQKLDQILISVVGQIKMLKLRFGSKELKLYDYPRVDGLGFLEFFLGNLKELQGHKKMSVIRNQIKALHMDIHSLVSSYKISEEKLTSGGLWTNIVRLAYQAEYVMDLYLVIPDSRCISTLSNIVEEVKEIKEKVLALPDKSLHVEDVALTISSPVHVTPLHVNDVLVGFEEDIVAIKKDLLTGESGLQVISIVGMGGAGKTSLAKHLFEESSVKHFDTKAWCTVSQTYQMKDLLLKIFNQINKSDIRDRDEQELADELCRSLKRRRYLVVIDDVWDVSIWNYLRWYFPVEETQSRVLITTRDSNVASGTNSKIHQLRALREDESWELLQKKLPQQESLPKHIEIIAKEVAESCRGLPLSIVVIGSLLHHAARNEEMWIQIAKDVTSTILSDPQGKCKAILELSYNHLSDNLKSCFLYLGVFPEDHEISVTHLVRLWVAEGLVSGITSEGSMEDVGRRYVDDFIARSLIIPIREKTEGGVKTFQLHDLLRDFCLEKAKDERFFTVLDDRGIFDCPRRISINGNMDGHLPSFSWNSVRTILSFDYSSEFERIMRSERVLLLNVLDMLQLYESPSYLQHYVHLRYLAVWELDCDERYFLESLFSKLLNLQVLILCFSDDSIEVPDLIWDLVKLRHIDIQESATFPCDSKKTKQSTVLLENLKSLSKAKLDYGDENWLTKLPELQKLSCIIFPFFDDSLQQYRFPELELCNRLTSLKVEYDPRWRGTKRRCELHLPASLRKLSLSGFDLDSDDLSGIGTTSEFEVLSYTSIH
ncbi:hypothetical protein Leryth_026132 [Lithospermum erythrorhizon]|nr:hypothetical protein Leryth_026132 [Lithospermum erythrorhizon]